MKKIFEITSVFIGLVIGAGFASGREIFEYFCIPSKTNLSGILIAAISFGSICYIILHLAQKINCKNFDGFIEYISGSFAPITKILMTLFMFCGYFVMLSACGALAEEAFNIPSIYGVLTLSSICFLVFSFNMKGIVVLNTIFVPIMICGMAYICFVTILAALPVSTFFDEMKSNSIISALCYVSYNTITAGAVLVPLSSLATKKQLTVASISSCFILGALIFAAWICMNCFQMNFSDSEMPLLVLAAHESEKTEKLYALVLFMALCTTAVSHGFGILSKFDFLSSSRRITGSAILCAIAIPFSRFGFSTLVSSVYSFFGYAGFLWTAILIYKYIKS